PGRAAGAAARRRGPRTGSGRPRRQRAGGHEPSDGLNAASQASRRLDERLSGPPGLPMVGEVLNPAPSPSDRPHERAAGAGHGLAAIRAHAGLAASDNALLEVLRDLERDRAQASDAARSVVRALAATLQARDGY